MMDFKDKNVLFVTTKNLDYLRNTQEIELIKKTADNVQIIGSDSKSYPKRLIKVFASLLKVSRRSFDTVWIGFAPQLVLPFFAWKFKKKEIWIDFFISMYDTMVCDRKKFKEKGLIAGILHWFDSVTLKKADHVIVDTKAHGKYFVEEFKALPDKINVLYLEADLSIYYPRPQRKPERLAGRYVVLYFGSVLPLQGLDVILEAVNLLKNHKKIYFILVGPIHEGYNKPKGENIEYHDWLSQQDLAEYISYSDLCLAGHFNKNINKAKRTIPGKAYIYHAMEKPMILGDNTATHELFTDSMQGIHFVEMGNPKKLAEKITELAGI